MLPAPTSVGSTPLLDAVTTRVRVHYGGRLVALVVFGSRGRGTARPDSDLDLLIVADGLPAGRLARVAEFAEVERALLASGVLGDGAVHCSAVFKSREEAEAGSPLFLDMVDDAQILYDRDGFFADRLSRLRTRLATLGARRVWRGNAWFWDLKPDYVAGEVFEL